MKNKKIVKNQQEKEHTRVYLKSCAKVLASDNDDFGQE